MDFALFPIAYPFFIWLSDTILHWKLFLFFPPSINDSSIFMASPLDHPVLTFAAGNPAVFFRGQMIMQGQRFPKYGWFLLHLQPAKHHHQLSMELAKSHSFIVDKNRGRKFFGLHGIPTNTAVFFRQSNSSCWQAS